MILCEESGTEGANIDCKTAVSIWPMETWRAPALPPKFNLHQPADLGLLKFYRQLIMQALLSSDVRNLNRIVKENGAGRFSRCSSDLRR